MHRVEGSSFAKKYLTSIQASDSPEVGPAEALEIGAESPDESSSGIMGTIKLSFDIKLYLVTKTVNLRQRCVFSSKESKISRWW